MTTELTPQPTRFVGAKFVELAVAAVVIVVIAVTAVVLLASRHNTSAAAVSSPIAATSEQAYARQRCLSRNDAQGSSRAAVHRRSLCSY